MGQYAKVLADAIKRSGFTLDVISEKCAKKGVKIHPTYISKLRLGRRPAPTDEISIVFAEVLSVDYETLHQASVFDSLSPDYVENAFKKFAQFPTEFPNYLKELRFQAGYDSVDTLSSAINIPIETLESIEQGKRLPLPEFLYSLSLHFLSLGMSESEAGFNTLMVKAGYFLSPEQHFEENIDFIDYEDTAEMLDNEIIDRIELLTLINGEFLPEIAIFLMQRISPILGGVPIHYSPHFLKSFFISIQDLEVKDRILDALDRATHVNFEDINSVIVLNILNLLKQLLLNGVQLNEIKSQVKKALEILELER